MKLATSTKRLCFIFLIIIVIAAACLVGFLYIIRSKIYRASALEAQAGEKSTLEEDNRSLHQLLDGSLDDINRLKSRVVGADGTVSFIDSIESYAKKSGASVTVENVAVDKAPNDADGYQFLSLNIKTHGSWSSISRFVTSLESLPYNLTLNTVELRQNGGNKENSAWDGILTLSVLQYK